MKILVVDDDHMILEMLENLLGLFGYQAILARDGQQAWETYQRGDIRMVITDLMMPRMNGIELCKKIRAFGGGQYTYIIVLTGFGQKEEMIEVFEGGADDYIPKPFDKEELKARVKTGERIIRLEEKHRQLQNSLLEGNNKIRTVFDSLHEEIVSIDNNRRIVSVNQAYINNRSVVSRDIIGKDFCTENFCTLPAGKEKISLSATFEKIFRTGDPEFLRSTIENYKGVTAHKEIHCLPVKNKAGKVFQIVVVTRDVTRDQQKADEIQKLNAELRQAVEQIRAKNETLENTLKQLKESQSQILQSEKMASIGQLAAGVAHEINNPTGFLGSNLKTLSDYMEDISSLVTDYRSFMRNIRSDRYGETDTAAFVERMSQISEKEASIDIDYILEDIPDLIKESREGTDRIKKIIVNLKDFAHPGDDVKKMADINDCLDSTLNIVWNEIKYKAEVSKQYGELPLVKCYPNQLNQVFLNLLVNAAQAIPDRGRIDIRTRSFNNQVEIIISDNGTGIPEEYLSKVFDPFFTTKPVGKGTGLGLNVAFNIIQKHQGIINIESTAGEGTVFTIKLPVGHAENETDDNSWNDQKQAGVSPTG